MLFQCRHLRPCSCLCSCRISGSYLCMLTTVSWLAMEVSVSLNRPNFWGQQQIYVQSQCEIRVSLSTWIISIQWTPTSATDFTFILFLLKGLREVSTSAYSLFPRVTKPGWELSSPDSKTRGLLGNPAITWLSITQQNISWAPAMFQVLY